MQTLEPIAELGTIKKCRDRAEVTLHHATDFKLKKGCELTEDGLAAILKYCAEDSTPTFYSCMNGSCYEEDRSKVCPFVPFMWLLLKTLWQLPPYSGREVYRGVKKDLREENERRKSEGKVVTFWAFT
eukprot:4161932-Amphidinium_carterae.1